MTHICDCGAHYQSLGGLEACQINNHGQRSPPDHKTWNEAIEATAIAAAKWDHHGDPGIAMYASPRIRDRILALLQGDKAEIEAIRGRVRGW